ncbi:hypothetical protein OTU49_011479 [Cherax quadricarinatus]|uniref:Kazal-like domain-containing protein n=1 Tax=Cherax quadricarinatus TaxID=27406 RepID=A0AAW0W2M4_CHEQU
MVQLATPLTCLVMVTLAVAKPQLSSGSVSQRLDTLRDVIQAGRIAVIPLPSTSSGSTRCREDCVKIYMPVCASNGRTYHNKCILEAESCKDRRAGGTGFVQVADVACEGDKNCQKDCGETYQPVCGTNGVTYDNKCELSIASCVDPTIGQRNEGVCAASVPSTSSGSTRCREECAKIYMPVCASNGRTYNNKCILEAESCKDRTAGGTGFVLVADGACEGDKNCQKDCGETYQPVCGTNGVTYNNKCELSIASCVNSTIGQRSEGICAVSSSLPTIISGTKPFLPTLGQPAIIVSAVSCLDTCTPGFRPVCGSDGVVYGSDCRLNLARCRTNNPTLVKRSDGVCNTSTSRVCDKLCDDTYAPVCGSDGATYQNHCKLQAATCYYTGLIKHYDGRCKV